MRKNRYLPAPWTTPIDKQSMTSMVWNISVGQLGCLFGYASSKLPHTCSLAEYEKLEEVLDFIAAAENIVL